MEESTIKLTRKEQIFLTAERLFKEKGYMASSMRDIAAELDIEAASLYSHIKSKDEILETICFRMADQFLESIAEANDLYFNAEERLKMAIKSHIKILTGDLNASSVFIREWRHLNEPRLSEFKELRNKYENEFRSILQNGEDENVFQTVDKKFAVLTILSALNWITEWYKPEGEMTSDEIAENLSAFILNGLRK
ncbi:MAG: TetR/AcrR family transcriptional regulator [Ignavibacteriae bacterium]|nr:MAG: TetR/AcrR family transcriptional regulator [Ignavibacteriota bacterium]